MSERGELLEWAQVFDNFYGTPRAPVEGAIAAGRDVLFDIDWQGTQQLKEQMARRPRPRLHPAAVDARSGEAPAGRAPRIRDEVVAPAHGQGGRRDQPLGRIRLRHRQRDIATSLRA